VAIDPDNEPILEENELDKFNVVVATELDNESILELSPEVVVATDEDKLPTLELKFKVVVATEPDNEPIEELRSDVVIATLELSEPILVDTLELKVE
jgi:ABC-type Fe3+-hydroxamate transport system substrate-binding protein